MLQQLGGFLDLAGAAELLDLVEDDAPVRLDPFCAVASAGLPERMKTESRACAVFCSAAERRGMTRLACAARSSRLSFCFTSSPSSRSRRHL